MVVRVTLWVLRVCAVLALILGIVFWTGNTPSSLVSIHMLLGILVVLSLWVIAVATATAKGGNWGLSGGALVLGLVIVALGLTQTGILKAASLHWIIQVIHLLLGLSAIGLGEAMAGRYKRSNATRTATA